MTIYGTGLTTDHYFNNITDAEGNCVLELEYDESYRIRIEDEDYNLVQFDFLVVDDQHFSFHMSEIEESISLSQSLTCPRISIKTKTSAP